MMAPANDATTKTAMDTFNDDAFDKADSEELAIN